MTKFVRLLSTNLSYAKNPNPLGSSTRWFSSTQTPSSQRVAFVGRKPGKTLPTELYRRISVIANLNNASIVPVLDQWVEEGNGVNKNELLGFIKGLRYTRRYSHALEISYWMSDKRQFQLTPRDVSVRLDLITKVHGVKQAENYFNSIPEELKGLEIYCAILNCYAHVKSVENVKCVEKAEAIMQRMRELGLLRTSSAYNSMLSLYRWTGNIERLENLRQEMDKNGVQYDKFTYTILLNAYAAVTDIERMEKTMAKMETDPIIVLDWITYGIMGTAYRKAGLLDKAFEMLRKFEGLINKRTRHTAYDVLLTQYAAIGKKDEVLRFWGLYKKKGKVCNVGYMNMMASLLKFDDLESAEKVFEDWESQYLNYDMRIPNFLIGAYSRKGLLEKAESLVERVISKGGKPDAETWHYLATGYLENNQVPKGVELMKKSIEVSKSSLRRKRSPKSYIACLEYLKGEGPEKAEEFVNLLGDKKIISSSIKDRLLNHIRKSGDLDALNVFGDNSVDEDSDSDIVRLVDPEEDNIDSISSTGKYAETSKA